MFACLAPDTPADWGKEALAMIRRNYYLPKAKLYSERPYRKQPAFNWGVGVMLSALNAAARVDKKYIPWLREYADASRVYWNKGGYDVLPAPKPLDRYYDDNAWMALALLETYGILKDEKYLKWARGALDFALSGKSSDAGGIYWREQEKSTMNTCSNAPTALACRLFARDSLDEVLNLRGEDLYEWTFQNLCDREGDWLYWDSLSTNGERDKTRWSYNTALMIRTSKYLNTNPTPTFDNSLKKWLVNGKLCDPGRFAHLLLEAWVDVKGYQEVYLRPLEAVRSARSPKGYYPAHWSELKVASNPELLDQAAFARACFVLAAGQKVAKQ
ncbi:MAG: glycoside hydrolase family 76 protein [Fimbriimonadaceae bacterium]